MRRGCWLDLLVKVYQVVESNGEVERSVDRSHSKSRCDERAWGEKLSFLSSAPQSKSN